MNNDSALSGVLSGLMAEEDRRAKLRKERISQLLGDGNECLTAEIKLIEKMRRQQTFDEGERHRLQVNRINALCDAMREDVLQRHLSEIEDAPKADEPADSKKQAETILKGE